MAMLEARRNRRQIRRRAAVPLLVGAALLVAVAPARRRRPLRTSPRRRSSTPSTAAGSRTPSTNGATGRRRRSTGAGRRSRSSAARPATTRATGSGRTRTASPRRPGRSRRTRPSPAAPENNENLYLYINLQEAGNAGLGRLPRPLVPLDRDRRPLPGEGRSTASRRAWSPPVQIEPAIRRHDPHPQQRRNDRALAQDRRRLAPAPRARPTAASRREDRPRLERRQRCLGQFRRVRRDDSASYGSRGSGDRVPRPVRPSERGSAVPGRRLVRHPLFGTVTRSRFSGTPLPRTKPSRLRPTRSASTRSSAMPRCMRG